MNIPDNKALAAISSAWKHAPHEHLSLWDMIPFLASEFYQAWLELEKWQKQAREWLNTGTEPLVPLQIHKTALFNLALKMEGFCATLEMKESLGKMRRFKSLISDPSALYARVMESEIIDIRQVIREEFPSRKFAFIPPDNAKYFEQDDLFGIAADAPLVMPITASEDISGEIKAAGNCLAADLHTAAAFHLMRAVELGMRALARHLDVAPPTWPIEYDEWGKLLERIGKKLDEVEKSAADELARGPEKDKKLATLRGLATEVLHFKDNDRNPCMHTRKNYDLIGALDLFTHVRACLKNHDC